MKSNKEKDYPTFLHIIPTVEIVDIQVRKIQLFFVFIFYKCPDSSSLLIVLPEIIVSQVLGDVEISYIGFGDESKEKSFYISETLTSLKDYT